MKPRRHARQSLVYPSAGIKHEGALKKHGYSIHKPTYERHEALRKSVHEDGYKTTVERVNALAVVNKGNDYNHRLLEYDLAYLRREGYERDSSKDTAGGPAFVNHEGKVVHDEIPEGGFRIWKV